MSEKSLNLIDIDIDLEAARPNNVDPSSMIESKNKKGLY